MNLQGKDELLRLAETVLAASKAEETEVVLMTAEDYLTRFAKNVIHQNVGSRHASVCVRTVTDRRIGVAEAEALDEETVTATLAKAQEISAVRPRLDDFKHLPKPGKISPIDAFDPATADCTPERRAELVAQLAAAARRKKAEAAGLVQTQTAEILVANSRGVRAYHSSTGAQFQAVVTCGDGSGFAEDQAFALDRIDTRRVIRDSVGKAVRSRKPQAIEAGEIDVVLEPAAVGGLVAMLGFLGFGAKTLQEGQSFMVGKLGQKITGENITIIDNARHTRLRGFPFDFEGVPRKRVKLIERGVAAGVVYDSYLAGRAGGRQRSTGHALPPKYSSYGAMPVNLVMDGGSESLAGLIAGTQRGLLVTRFHYINVVEQMKAVLTGMTRDGTFLIENGKIVGPVTNLRFTEAVLEAFARTAGLTKSRRLVEEGVLCPAMKIKGFRFTGTTGF